MTTEGHKELALLFGEDSLSFILDLQRRGAKIVLADSPVAPHTADILSYGRRSIRDCEEVREVLEEEGIPFSSMVEYGVEALSRGLINGSYGFGLKKECLEPVDKLLSAIPASGLFVQSGVSLLRTGRLALFTLMSDFYSFMKLTRFMLDEEAPNTLLLGCLGNPLSLATKRLAEEMGIEVRVHQSEVPEPIRTSSSVGRLWKRYSILRATGWLPDEIVRESVRQAMKRISPERTGTQSRVSPRRHTSDVRILSTYGIRGVIPELTRLEDLFDMVYLRFNTGLPMIYDSGGRREGAHADRERAKERLTKGWEAIWASRECHEALTIQGIRLLGTFEEVWRFYFCEFLLDYSDFTSWIAWEIDRIDPQVALVETDQTPGPRVLVELCNLRGIPTVVSQHGVMAAGFGFVPLVASKIAVWGEIPREWLVERGTEAEKVAMTGWPRYDAIKNPRQILAGKGTSRRLRVGPGRPIILLGLQPTADAEKVLLIESCIRCLKELPEVVLVIRQHPSEAVAGTLRLAVRLARKHAVEGRVRVNAETIQKYPGAVFELIAASELVITSNSGIGLDAILLRKPLIAANLARSPDDIDYAGYGAARRASNAEELSESIKKILRDGAARETLLKEQDEFLRRYCIIDGKSIERFASLIRDLPARSSAIASGEGD